MNESLKAIFDNNTRMLIIDEYKDWAKRPAQDEIGKKIGISQRWVSYLLGENSTDTTSSVRTDTIEKVAKYYDIESYRLLMPWPNINALKDKRLDKVIECYKQVENDGRNNITNCAENEARYNSATKLLQNHG